jgi:hypothetical protein
MGASTLYTAWCMSSTAEFAAVHAALQDAPDQRLAGLDHLGAGRTP